MTIAARALAIPSHWDRRGLPGWTYHSAALFELERREVFLTHWQVVGHVCDLAAPGDWLSYDMLGERALVMRGQDGVIRAFHNLCRHRGARVTEGVQGTFGDVPGRQWSVRHYVKLAPRQDWLPAHLQSAWSYYGLFPNAVLAFTPESVQFYQEIPISPTQTRLTGRLYRRPDESRQQRLARYLATRIDRETSAEDQQLSLWSNESMKSSGFDRFHLSDLEYGVRCHHDQLRALLPVLRRDCRPEEDQIAGMSEILHRQKARTT